ncbi:MAG: relaxase/mobilization nuclease domain-containing protein [Clostridia bacterium]
MDPKTADEEFLLKTAYQHITGRQQKNNIIAYRYASPLSREITPEEANQVGYETAMHTGSRFHRCTHIDKSHIHNHIIYN